MARSSPLRAVGDDTPHKRRSEGPRGSAVRWDRVQRKALVLGLSVIFILYIAPVKHWIDQYESVRSHRSELADLARTNQNLRQQVTQLKGPQAVEQSARRLGMVRTGEQPFVIQNPPPR